MSLGIVKLLLEGGSKDQPAVEKKGKKIKKRLEYKDLLRAEQEKRENQYLLRAAKKKPTIRKMKDKGKDNRKVVSQISIIEKIQNAEQKKAEDYKIRMKAWKDEFQNKGKVAPSIAKSVISRQVTSYSFCAELESNLFTLDNAHE